MGQGTVSKTTVSQAVGHVRSEHSLPASHHPHKKILKEIYKLSKRNEKNSRFGIKKLHLCFSHSVKIDLIDHVVT